MATVETPSQAGPYAAGGTSPDGGRGSSRFAWSPRVVTVIVLLAGAGVAAGFTAERKTYTNLHRAAAAGSAVLVVVAFAYLAHVVVLAYQRVVTRALGATSSNPTVDFRRRGLKAAVIGTDGRASTSKTQIMAWTAAVVGALTYLLLLTRSVPGGTLFTDAVTKNWRPEYLVLLGLPAAAAVVAKTAVTSSNNGLGPVDPTTAAAAAASLREAAVAAATATGATAPDHAVAQALMAQPRRIYVRAPLPVGTHGFFGGLAELITDESGVVSWRDLQYVAFTLITLANFVAQVVAEPAKGLPAVPAALLTLMGVSATTYAAGKAIEAQGTVQGP